MYMNVIEFVTLNIWGVLLSNIICGVVGSIIGALLYKAVLHKYKRRRIIKNLVKAGTYFGSGSRTVYALNKTSFHQILLVGDYLIDIILSLFKLLICGVVVLVLLILFRAYWISTPIIIGIASMYCGIEYLCLRDYLKLYQQMFKYVFGDEYFKSEMEGIIQYWDKMANRESKSVE
jgi:hypothetical protein